MDLYEALDKLNIKYEEVSHAPLYTVNDANNANIMLDGVGCKNLFLKDKKNYYLYILEDNKRADLKELSISIDSSKLHFASEEELNSILGLKRGSVTPLGIINDKDSKITIIIDKNLVGKRILVHPNINTKTMSLEYSDLIKYIEFCENRYIII